MANFFSFFTNFVESAGRPANNFNATDRALLAADRYRGREEEGGRGRRLDIVVAAAVAAVAAASVVAPPPTKVAKLVT